MIPAVAATPPISRDPDGSSFSRRLFLILLAIGTVIYAGFLGMNVGACASGSDASGYLNSAKLLWHGRTSTAMRALPGLPASDAPDYTYVPLGFRPSREGEMVPTYPIGLPLLVNATAIVSGSRLAPNWTLWWNALAGVGLMFVLGRLAGLPPGWAALGGLLMAVCPLHIFFSLQMMSDMPATTWATATIVFAWLARRNTHWAWAAGFALGWAVLIRPTNLLLIVPAIIALGADARRLLRFAGGGAPAAVVLCFYNWHTYGNPLVSGYGSIHHLFVWENVPASLAHYGRWLPVLLTPLGVLALGLPMCARRAPRWTAVLGAWLLVFLILYSLYSFTHETWWYLRFVMPAFPAAWVAALLVLRAGLDRTGWPRFAPTGSPVAWIAGALAAMAIFAYAHQWNRQLATFDAGRGEQTYVQAIEWMQKQIPKNSALLAMQTSGALFYYTDLPIVRWDELDAVSFEKIARVAAAASRPLFAFLLPFEESLVFAAKEKHVTGRWTKVGAFEDFTLWRFEPPPA